MPHTVTSLTHWRGLIVWHLNTSLRRLSLSKSESPASHPSVTRLFQCGAIESPTSRQKMWVLREAVLARGDWPLLYDKLAISNTYSHAKNRNDLRPIALSKVPFPEVGFSAFAILGGGWLQSPPSDGPPWECFLLLLKFCENSVLYMIAPSIRS